ncbi:hypothetical protein [Albirhodobacter sp. R86504]|uniref:hypothetical protein n=1 Tax=Albirhodobacter sp. R86504 TaxID=3093848 RepID=UPI00366CDC2B
MPKLVSFYIRNVLIGFAAAVVFVGLLLGLNIANLRTLILGSDIGVLAVVMLVVFNTIVFGAVQFGIAIMAMAEDDDESNSGGGFGGGGRRPAPRMTGEMIPVRVAQESRKTRR